MRRKDGALAGLALLIGFAGAAPAHGQQEHPIVWSAHLDGAPRVSPGATIVIVASAAIPPGWHVYSLTQAAGGPIRMTMTVGPADVARLGGSISAPRPITADDPNFGMQTETYEDSATFHVPGCDRAKRCGRKPSGGRDRELPGLQCPILPASES